MRPRSHLPDPERRARSRLTQILHEQPFLCGSLVTMQRTCGKPGCKCTRGELHPGLYLALRVGGTAKDDPCPSSHGTDGPSMGCQLSGSLAIDGADLGTLFETIFP